MGISSLSVDGEAVQARCPLEARTDPVGLAAVAYRNRIRLLARALRVSEGELRDTVWLRDP